MSYNLIPFPLDITPEAALKIVESRHYLVWCVHEGHVQRDAEALEDIRSLSEQLTYIEHSLKALSMAPLLILITTYINYERNIIMTGLFDTSDTGGNVSGGVSHNRP